MARYIGSRKAMPKGQNPKGMHVSTFYTTRRYPFYMMTVTKCGCTFLKNLFYYLDFDAPHPLGNDIHQDESDLVRGNPDYIDEIAASPYRFITIRDPESRFWSLYLEKIYGTGARSFGWFREEIGYGIGMDFAPDLDIEGHRRNAEILLDWLEENIAGRTDHAVDFHWRPFFRRYNRIHKLEPVILTLDRLERQLPHVLRGLVPDIESRMAAVTTRNRGGGRLTQDMLSTGHLAKRILDIYPQDQALYETSQRMWESGEVDARIGGD